MKKLIALMLVIAFVFALSACNDKNTASNTDTNASTSSETFVKPENYASVLLVSINPQFKLYLDGNNNVLAVEPVNEDAKTFSDNIDFENKSIETVIGNIVEQANEKGFIKENVTVNFEITEQKNGINSDDILSKVVSAANQKATELNIEIKTEIKESDNSQTIETNSENTQTDESSKPTTSSKTEETTKKEESASKPTTTTKPTESSKPTHTHNFSVATCTAPQKCSCGVTQGSASGHKWIDATCKAPKTCSVCKKTEGNKSEHIVKGTTCQWCKKVVTVSITNFNSNCTYSCSGDKFSGADLGFPPECECYNITFLCFDNNELFASTQSLYSDVEGSFKHNGKFYDSIAEGMGLNGNSSYKILNNEIIVTAQAGYEDYAIINLQLQSDNTLKVTSISGANISPNAKIEIGSIFYPNAIFY